MSNSNYMFWYGLYVGALLGMFLGLLLYPHAPKTLEYKANTLIVECEKSIPRDENCQIVAVRETELKDME